MSERPDDEDLVRRAQAGDESALTVLMQRYQALLIRRAERQLPGFLRPRVSVADVVQEAQILVHERHREFEDRGEGSFRNWLLKIVDLKVKEVLRTHTATAKRALDREVVKRTNVRTAYFVSPAIDRISSFSIIWLRCDSTVLTLMFKMAAISFDCLPSATSCNTSRSRGRRLGCALPWSASILRR